MFATTMPDTQSTRTRRPAELSRSSPTLASSSEPAGTGFERDQVTELREALRAAERGYHAYLTELRQGDVEPLEDWSTWYAEYLLGLR
jgi:hypothetical protein